MPPFLVRTLVTTLAVLVAAYTIPGIYATDLLATVVAALVLGLLNAFVRPVLVVLTLPVTILSLGLFLLVINALLLLVTASVVKGFAVSGFGAALLGAVVISVVGSLLGTLFGRSG